MENFSTTNPLAVGVGITENVSDPSSYNHTDSVNVAEHRSAEEISLGIIFAVICNVLLGLSIVIRRRAMQNVAKEGQVRASEGGCGFWKSGMWWLGTLCLLLAQAFIFGSLILAPAILVAPVGVLRILASAAAARIVLKEKMKSFGWLGCILVICGCVIFIVSGPKDKDISTMEEYRAMFLSPSFLSFLSFIAAMTVILLALAPKYGSRHVMLYVLVEGGNGSLCVWLSKGLGIGLVTRSFSDWVLWITSIVLLVNLSVQFMVNNRSADLFDAALVMSCSYVVLTTGVILLSLILFSSGLISIKDGVLMSLGFFVNVIGLIVMMKGKNIDVNLFVTDESHNQDINNEVKKKEESIPPESNEVSLYSPVSLQIAHFINEISKVIKERNK